VGEQGASGGGDQGRTAKDNQSSMGQRRSSQRRKSPKAKPSPKGKSSPRGKQSPKAKAGPKGNQSGKAKRPSPTPSGERSTVDAMGQDKHRQVIGQKFGLSRGRQFLYYGIFVAFLVAAYIGLRAATAQLDKAPAHDPDQAPWSQPGAPQGPLGGFEPAKPGQKGPANFQ